MTRPIDRILALLKGVRRAGSSYQSLCPTHPDRQVSLSIDEGKDGRVLLKCFAGCTTETIVEALGLSMADLFARSSERRQRHARGSKEERNPGGGGAARGRGDGPRGDGHSNARMEHEGLTLVEYAAAKALPLAFLQRLGLSDVYVGRPAVRMPYLDRTGLEISVRFRQALIGGDRFRWRRGSKLYPYGLWRLEEARRAGFVVVVEGESDCHTLWFHEIPAIGIPGAATWQEAWADYFDEIPQIYVILEPDRGGEALDRSLRSSRLQERLRLVDLHPHKDPSALHLASGVGFAVAWQAALAKATPWTERSAGEQRHRAEEAFDLAKELLHAPDILNRVGRAMAAAGYAGDTTPAELAWVAISSRLLERPLNLVFVAPSAAGKNRAVDAAVEYVPAEAVYIMSAASPRVLIYTTEDFQHRMIIVKEADSLPDEGPAASAIRSVAEDNSLVYEVVEKNPSTRRFETRRIEKKGPTGLITTSTRSLKIQLGTRHLEQSLSDDPEQTRNVMRAHAQQAAHTRPAAPDPTPFIALQRYLALSDTRRVTVPFAEVLAQLVPAVTVRMRRDFRQLLTCVQTIALLRQCQRARTADGVVIATIDDYAEARRLLETIFDTIVTQGVTTIVRQTVETVRTDEEVTEAELATRLGLAKSTVSYRVRKAVAGGWLENRETRRGRPARLARGTPLPEPLTALPVATRVRELFDHSDGRRPDGCGPARSNGERVTPMPTEDLGKAPEPEIEL
jgi:hypothetical protein